MDNKFKSLVLEYQDNVYNQTYRMLGNREDAEEASQDVFLQVYRSLASFRGECRLSTWIYRITYNVCLNKLKKKKIKTVIVDNKDSYYISEKWFADNTSNNPEKALLEAEIANTVRSGLQELPPKWAMALSLFYFEGLSYEDISEIMEIPKSTAATYIFRGKKELALILSKLIKQESSKEKR